MKIRFICITLSVIFFSATVNAGVNISNAPQVKKITPQINRIVTSKKNMPITIEIGDIEIVTTLADTHFWQLGITNTSSHSAEEFKVFVDVEGFREEDRVSTVGTVERLEPGRTHFARAKLPQFEGMHQFRIRTGGAPKVVQIPRPFRRDANGNPAGALKINRIWARMLGGKIRWYMKTEPNVYGPILPNKVKLMVTFRERKKEYCHQEAFKKIGYMDHQQLISYISPETHNMVTNKAVIKPGESMTFSGELNQSTAKPHLPDKVDRLTVEMLSGDKESVLLPGSFFAPYKECTDE
ncbi:MAG TPA: hypothetical protein DHV36_19935 [Desulfobacteraceae bacterium]|nr:hypothetical protein [Desulfobacteraceae bacterium]|tara:strand:- start:946 stop:1833 length:888 start_codon:yes stop_codon:yes gene_type:complete